MRNALRAAAVAASLSLLPGCMSPSYIVKEPYQHTDCAYVWLYMVCYDATAIAHGYPLPLMLGFKLDRGSLWFNFVATTTMPGAFAGMLVGGTVGAPFVFLVTHVG